MAAMRALEWIRICEGPAGVLDMNYQTCSPSSVYVLCVAMYADGSMCDQVMYGGNLHFTGRLE